MIKIIPPIATALIFLITSSPVHSDSVLKINEFLAHPATGNKEWVEFYNPDNVDLASYYLDDDTDFNSDTGTRSKKSLAAYNNSNPTYPFLEFSSFLNNSGDFVVLFSPTGTIIDQHEYTDDPGDDIAIGRSPDGSGNFYSLQSATKGSSNGSPASSPSPEPQQEESYSTPSNPTSPKSPSPTPKNSPSPSPKSPSPSPKKSPESVLGEKEESQPTPTPAPTPSPSPSPQTLSKTKVAGILTGGGLVIIGASVGFFLWYQKTMRLKEEDKDKQSFSSNKNA